MTEPTDKELEAFAVEEQFLLFCDVDEFTQIARAVLAKWGSQPMVREPLTDEQYNILVEDLSEWSRHVEVDTAPRSLEEHIHQVFAIHGIKGGRHER